MRTPWLALACILAVTPAAFGQSAPGASPTPPAAAPSVAPSPALVVHTKDFAYVPKDARIKAGDTILFVNDDDSAHTITADDKSFDSGYMARGATWSHTFTTAGSVAYFCAYHTFMRATVTVAQK